MTTSTQLPQNLPVPEDDGACDHLLNETIPNISLIATNGQAINLQDLKGRLVIYCYPMTKQPDKNLPDGWAEIPGAMGCTPQSCSFRDHYSELKALNTTVYGLSTQTTAYQQEVKERLHLPFELLSDSNLLFSRSLKLPYLYVDEMTLIKRITLIFEEGKIVKYFYPVFPPDKNIDEVLEWLQTN